MLIKSVSAQNIKKSMLFIFVIICIVIVIHFSTTFLNKNTNNNNTSNDSNPNDDVESYSTLNELSSLDMDNLEEAPEATDKNGSSYIKWVDFKGTATALSKLANLDISSHVNNEDVKFNWIELMAYLGSKYGGDFSRFKQSDLDDLVKQLKSGSKMDDLSKKYKLYSYFYESYDAIFHGYIGDYTIQTDDGNGNKVYKTSYGIKVFCPIAKGYSFSHYNDFGASRSYGYKRVHLGNDLLRKHWYSNCCCRIWLYRSFRLESVWWLESWNT